MLKHSPVIAVIEKMTLPAYKSPTPEEMPVFAETRQHQGTSGNPYPVRAVPKVDRSGRTDKEYEVIRLENDFIRVIVMPEIGGRIFEAYDKKTGYDFIYRQHSIKPVLIGAYGSWIAGGIEFNWPFHHRPSTFMPVDFELVQDDDGSAVVWLSEHDPSDRTKGMVGIRLRSDTSYFETAVRITNRTPLKHSFLWWECAGIHVNKDYQLIFPPDVAWVHHHYDRSHITYPVAQGQYGAETFSEPTDISWHKNTLLANSYFAAPSQYDFFGGYDHSKNSGIMHVADHHVSPGKKMFTWGYGTFADNWKLATTDTDGPYAELMAGSYTDDQPDFTWIAPFETKSFSQFWYPTHLIKAAVYANLNGAFSVDRNGKDSKVRLIVTRDFENAHLKVWSGENTVLDETVDISPSECKEFPVILDEKKYRITFISSDDIILLDYSETIPDNIHIPKDNKGIPMPSQLKTPQEICIAGLHIDQYRDPLLKPDIYYKAALAKDADFLPALIGMGSYCYRMADYGDALSYLNKAKKIQNTYNTNPLDGEAGYLTGLALFMQEKYDEAYDNFYKAAWSANAISSSYSYIAAIDCRRGDYGKMREHALKALDKESTHPIAGPYEVLSLIKSGDTGNAVQKIDAILSNDPLNHLARFVAVLAGMYSDVWFFDKLSSNPSQTCLDVGFDLMNAGAYEESIRLFEGLKKYGKPSAMALYTLAYAYGICGESDTASQNRRSASENLIADIFPYRNDEIRVLEKTLEADPDDGFAAYLLGCVLYDRAHHTRAAALWHKATLKLPDFYIPYRNLAVAYYSHLGRRGESIGMLKKAVELHPNDEQLMNEISFVMAHLGVDGNERAEYLETNKPEKASDNFILEIVRSYNAAGQYDKALSVMLSHNFTPSEGGEFAVADAYMFGRFALGRIALSSGDTSKALGYFKQVNDIPANLHVGFWNKSVIVPYRYYEAKALSIMGNKTEADDIINDIVKTTNEGMWNMGGEFTYYYAMTIRLSGNPLKADEIMRQAVSGWEEQMDNDSGGFRSSTPFYLSYIDDAIAEKKSALYYLLAYGKLYNNDIEGAKELWAKSLELNPDNVKCKLELDLG
ncbi:MAG: DUF5107 domain-containing protein [Saccharofermentanales bacterium]